MKKLNEILMQLNSRNDINYPVVKGNAAKLSPPEIICARTMAEALLKLSPSFSELSFAGSGDILGNT